MLENNLFSKYLKLRGLKILSENERNDLDTCSEVILSNSTYGVRGIKKINEVTYNNSNLYKYLINSLNNLI